MVSANQYPSHRSDNFPRFWNASTLLIVQDEVLSIDECRSTHQTLWWWSTNWRNSHPTQNIGKMREGEKEGYSSVFLSVFPRLYWMKISNVLILVLDFERYYFSCYPKPWLIDCTVSDIDRGNPKTAHKRNARWYLLLCSWYSYPSECLTMRLLIFFHPINGVQ